MKATAYGKVHLAFFDLNPTGYEVRVYTALRALDFDNDGTVRGHSIARIAEAARTPLRSAERAVKGLADKGAIEIVPQSRGGQRTASMYRFLDVGTDTGDGTDAPAGTDVSGGAGTDTNDGVDTDTSGGAGTDTSGGASTQTGLQTHSDSSTRPRGRFRRGAPSAPEDERQGRTKTSGQGRGSGYPYNQFAQPCHLCAHWVQVEGGTLLLNPWTQKRVAAHHLDECLGYFLTEEERQAHLEGRTATARGRALAVVPGAEQVTA